MPDFTCKLSAGPSAQPSCLRMGFYSLHMGLYFQVFLYGLEPVSTHWEFGLSSVASPFL